MKKRALAILGLIVGVLIVLGVPLLAQNISINGRTYVGAVLFDVNGDPVSVGGGTQYSEDTVHVSGDQLNMMGAVQVNACGTATSADGDRAAVQLDTNGQLCVAGGGGGTQYTEGNTDATITGTALLFEGAANTLVAAPGTAAAGLLVNISNASLTVGDGAGALNVIIDSGALTATVTDGAGALNVIVDSGALTATVTDGAGALNVIVDSSATITVTDGAGALNVICDSGCSGSGGTSLADGADFTAGTTAGTPVIGFYQSTVTACTDGDACVAGITTGRAVKVALSDAAGALLTVASDVTIGTAIGTSGPLGLAVYSDFDGSALPTITNVDTEGEGVPIAASIKGIQYVMLTGEDGSLQYGTATTPLVVGDAGGGAMNVICDSGCGSSPVYDHSGAITIADSNGVLSMLRASAAAPSTTGIVDDDAVIAWALATGALVNQPSYAGVLAVAGSGTNGTGVQRFTLATDDEVNDDIDAINTKLDTLDNPVFVDEAAFTYTTSSVSVFGAVAESTTDAIADGLAGALTMSLDRRLNVTFADPCSSGATKQYIPIDIVTATTTEITPALAGASTHYYICSVNLVTAAANNVAIVDDNTDGCGSPTAGIFGGVTAAEGWNFGANGGIALGGGIGSVGRTVTTNAVICIVTSAATQLSGQIVVAAAL